ncbi:MAG: hypothetical protein IPJ24_04400 [bacterium]|nr:hypothetical protein [bacterium]
MTVTNRPDTRSTWRTLRSGKFRSSAILHGLFLLAISCLAACHNEPIQPLLPPTYEATWNRRFPTPSGNPLMRLDMSSDSIGTVVGHLGTIMRTEDGGRTWMTQAGGTQTLFWDVDFVGPLHGVAVGSDGVILTTSDGGRHWISRDSDTTEGLSCVRFSDRENGFIVGENGTLLRTRDGGRTWSRRVVATDSHLHWMRFANPELGLIVGEHGLILRTVDGGLSWQQRPSGTDKQLYAMCFADERMAIAVGEDGVCVRSDDGGWTWHSTPRISDESLSMVSFVDSDTGFAVDVVGRIMKSTDGGSNWTLCASGYARYLADVQVQDRSTVYAVGDEILKSTDAGETWHRLIERPWVHLPNVVFANADLGIAVGDTGVVLRTDDGGRSWLPCDSGTSVDLIDVAFVGEEVGVIVGAGGTVLVSHDRGQSWNCAFSAGDKASPLDSRFRGVFRAVALVDGQRGVVVGDSGTIAVTSDGFQTWSFPAKVTANTLYDVAWSGPDTVVAAGELGTVLLSADGGMTWVCRATCTWARFIRIGFGESGCDYGLCANDEVFLSGDCWATWSSQSVPEGFVLGDIQFSNIQTGIVVGVSGLHRTSDGGRSWTREMVLETIFAESMALNPDGFISLSGLGIIDSR